MTPIIFICLLGVARISAFAIGNHDDHEHRMLKQDIEALENSLEAMLQKMEAMEQNLMEPLKKAIALGATKKDIEKNIIEPLVLQALLHGQSQQASVDNNQITNEPSSPEPTVVPVNIESKAAEPEVKIPGFQIVPVIRISNEIQSSGPNTDPQRIIPQPRLLVPPPQLINMIPEPLPQLDRQPKLINMIPEVQSPRLDTPTGAQATQQLAWIDVIPKNSSRSTASDYSSSGLTKLFPVSILRYRVSYPENGRFQYEYETENGIKQRAEGYPGSKGQSNMRGAFSWPMEDGDLASFSYEADENGYRVQSNMLPVAPPAPAHVAGLIAMAKEQKAKGIVFN